MKNQIVFFLVIGTLGILTGCGGPKAPSFEKLENLKVVSANNSKVILKGKALYHNPNPITGTLTNTNIKILVNDIQVTEINQDHAIAVPESSDFRVPVSFSFNPKKLRTENKGFLRNVIKSFVNKNMEVQYFGTVTIQVMGVDFDVPIDYTEKVSFGINQE